MPNVLTTAQHWLPTATVAPTPRAVQPVTSDVPLAKTCPPAKLPLVKPPANKLSEGAKLEIKTQSVVGSVQPWDENLRRNLGWTLDNKLKLVRSNCPVPQWVLDLQSNSAWNLAGKATPSFTVESAASWTKEICRIQESVDVAESDIRSYVYARQLPAQIKATTDYWKAQRVFVPVATAPPEPENEEQSGRDLLVEGLDMPGSISPRQIRIDDLQDTLNLQSAKLDNHLAKVRLHQCAAASLVNARRETQAELARLHRREIEAKLRRTSDAKESVRESRRIWANQANEIERFALMMNIFDKSTPVVFAKLGQPSKQQLSSVPVGPQTNAAQRPSSTTEGKHIVFSSTNDHFNTQ